MHNSKHLVIRMLQELTGYINAIKNTQAKMKAPLSEIKQNLQGTNSERDEPENQINDLEHKEECFSKFKCFKTVGFINFITF